MGPSVTPHALISETDKTYRLISTGIDTLDLGCYVEWPSARLHAWLEQERTRAAGTDGILVEKHGCILLPGGKGRMYRFHLQYPDGHLFLTKNERLHNFPNVYVSIASKALWTIGANPSVELFCDRIRRFGGTITRMVPSRVDLAADLEIPGGLSLDFIRQHIVCQSDVSRHHMDGEKLQTYYAGAGSCPIQLRIYDKWAELKHSDKYWFMDVWKAHDTSVDVSQMWRVEGQLRRVVLKQLSIETLDDLYMKLGGLWAYLTSWGSLRLPDHENVTRRTLHPLWALVVSAGKDLGESTELKRQYARNATAPVKWYVSHMAGCLAGFASRLNIWDLDAALSAIREHISPQITPEYFKARVTKELIRLGEPTPPEVQP